MGRCWLVEGGGWNLADSVIRCARFLDSVCPKMGRCRAPKNGLGTSFARPSSCFWGAQESWVRIADSKLGQNQGATPRRSPCSRGREPRPRFRDSTRARGAHTQEPDRIGRARAQVGPRARAQIPRLRSATRPKIPRLWGELTRFRRAVPRQNRGRGATPRRSPCSRGREPRPRFRDSTRARGAHTQEPDRIGRARGGRFRAAGAIAGAPLRFARTARLRVPLPLRARLPDPPNPMGVLVLEGGSPLWGECGTLGIPKP